MSRIYGRPLPQSINVNDCWVRGYADRMKYC